MLNIIDYELPLDCKGQYIVLESISSNSSKIIHVINMGYMNKIELGRGHEVHIRVTDISVSRIHCVITKHKNGFYYLSDNKSKFGTLALVRSPL